MLRFASGHGTLAVLACAVICAAGNAADLPPGNLEFDAFTMRPLGGDGWEITERAANHVFLRKQLESSTHALACEVTARPRKSQARGPDEYLAEWSGRFEEDKPDIMKKFEVSANYTLDPECGPLCIREELSLVSRQAVVERAPVWTVWKRRPARKSATRVVSRRFIHPDQPDLEFSVYAKHFGMEDESYPAFGEFQSVCFRNVLVKSAAHPAP